MAQYVSKTYTADAYKIGAANIPAWFEEAIAEDKLVQVAAPGGCLAGWLLREKDGDVFVNIGDYIIKTGTELQAWDGTFFESQYLFDDARLLTVLTKNDATTTGTGAAATKPIVWGIDVLNTVETLGLAEITAGTNATFKLFSDATFETEITGANTLALTAGAATSAYIKVTSAAATNVLYYKVAITRAAA